MENDPTRTVPIDASRDGETEVRSLARAAYFSLRTAIIQGKLRPLQRLKVVDLARELGFNSSAIREALSRLTAEELVEARDQRGFRVAALSIEELDDLTRSRIDIETMMLRRSIENGRSDPAWIARIETARDIVVGYQGDRTSPTGVRAHNEFHESLLGACASPSMLRIRANLFALTQRYRSFAVHAAPHWQVDLEHAEIATATLAFDADRAAKALAEHIGNTAAILRRSFADAKLERDSAA